MDYFAIWLIGVVLLLSVSAYIIGRYSTPSQRDDLPGIVFVMVVASIFWPFLLGIGCVVAPFYLPYKFGVKRRLTAESKEKVWNTLKK